jgi:hypothetical protein
MNDEFQHEYEQYLTKLLQKTVEEQKRADVAKMSRIIGTGFLILTIFTIINHFR